jgi:hypothetical protein
MSGPQSTTSWKAAMAIAQLIAILVGVGVGLWVFQQVAS